MLLSLSFEVCCSKLRVNNVCRATQTLTDDQAAWVKQTNERVLKILRETPPDGEVFTNTVMVVQRAACFDFMILSSSDS